MKCTKMNISIYCSCKIREHDYIRLQVYIILETLQKLKQIIHENVSAYRRKGLEEAIRQGNISKEQSVRILGTKLLAESWKTCLFQMANCRICKWNTIRNANNNFVGCLHTMDLKFGWAFCPFSLELLHKFKQEGNTR
jgi:hypothetical protein